jgi:diguanylate cyclase (GGDEF)-like protein/PAS domain S-box-containing protein
LVLLREQIPIGWASLWVATIVLLVLIRRAACGFKEGDVPFVRAGFSTRRRICLASEVLEGSSWAVLIWFAPISDANLSYALAILVTAFAFCRLSGPAQYGAAGPLSVLPILLVQALVFAVRPLPYGAPLLCIWLLLSVFGLLSFSLAAAREQANAHETQAQATFAAQQRTLLNALTVGVLVTCEGIIEDCNEKFLALFGYTRAEIVGRDSRLLLALATDRTEEELGQAALLAHEPITRKASRRRRDGSVFEVELSVGLIEPTNPDSRVVSVYEDITEKLQIERELRLSRERLRLALDSLQSGVWDVDLKEERCFFSRRFKSILGFDEQLRLTGPSARLFFHHEFIHPEDRAGVAEARMAMLLQGAPFDEQYRVIRERRVFWVRETVLALLDGSQSPYRFTGSITDTTTINAIQDRLRASEAFHRNLIDASNALIWCTDLKGILTFVNERGARELYGYESSEMIGRAASEFVAPESKDRLALAMQRPLRQGASIRNLEVIHITSTQHRIFVSVNAVPMFDAAGALEGVMGIATDITHLKKRERAFQDATRLQRLIFDSAGEGIVLVRNQRIYRANQAFADLVGATIGELVARPLSQSFGDPDQWDKVEGQLTRLGNVIKAEQQLVQSNGARIWVSVTGRCAEMAEHGSIYIWVFADISATKAQEEQSWHRANHDELTGLANRRLLRDRLEQTMGLARREGHQAALFMLDLDGFKAVNDAHGHAFGDEVLKEVAHRLSDNVRALDITARLGGDEFVVVLHEIVSREDVEIMAQRLIDEIARPVRIAGREVTVGASVGIAIFPDTATGIAGLMQSADMAMYSAKARGRGRFQFADESVETLPIGRSQDL